MLKRLMKKYWTDQNLLNEILGRHLFRLGVETQAGFIERVGGPRVPDAEYLAAARRGDRDPRAPPKRHRGDAKHLPSGGRSPRAGRQHGRSRGGAGSPAAGRRRRRRDDQVR